MPVNARCLCFLKVWAKIFLYRNLNYRSSQIWDLHGSSPMVRKRRRSNYFWKSKEIMSDFVHVSPLVAEDFSGWTTNSEVLPYDRSGIPAGAVVCQLPRYRWALRMVWGSESQNITTILDEIITAFWRDVTRPVWWFRAFLPAGFLWSSWWTWRQRDCGTSCWIISSLKYRSKTGKAKNTVNTCSGCLCSGGDVQCCEKGICLLMTFCCFCLFAVICALLFYRYCE